MPILCKSGDLYLAKAKKINILEKKCLSILSNYLTNWSRQNCAYPAEQTVHSFVNQRHHIIKIALHDSWCFFKAGTKYENAVSCKFLVTF